MEIYCDCDIDADLASTTHMDDEYAWAGVEDPKIVVTTSHNPSTRLKQFAKVCIIHIQCTCTWCQFLY